MSPTLTATKGTPNHHGSASTPTPSVSGLLFVPPPPPPPGVQQIVCGYSHPDQGCA